MIIMKLIFDLDIAPIDGYFNPQQCNVLYKISICLHYFTFYTMCISRFILYIAE